MTRYRATLAYDGSAYFGFQRQAGDTPTIQGRVEAALKKLNKGVFVPLYGAGRTDAGVHASGQVIAFDLDWRHDANKLQQALNAHLPPDIAVQTVAVAAPGFHPRFDASSRQYRYTVYEVPVRQPLLRGQTWQIYRHSLNIDAMQRSAAKLVGIHDFATFGKPPQGNNTVREVYASHWVTTQDIYGTRHTYTVEATAFLKHMVRRIVAMLVDLGLGRYTPASFEAAFRRAQLKAAQRLAPPQGLSLVAVRYATEEKNGNKTQDTIDLHHYAR